MRADPSHPDHPAFVGTVGIARADITPPPGIYCRNWGAAAHDTARGVHRPLSLTAVALDDRSGGRPLVLVDADLGWWSGPAYERAFRERLRTALDLPPERLLFALTHTHAAPPLTRPEPHWPGGDLLVRYHEAVWQAACDAGRRAIAAAEPARVEWQLGSCRLAANRDLPEPAAAGRGTVPGRVVCGYHPRGEADDTLLVGRITTTAGRPLATIVNYACHPTTLAWDNTLVSPDYVGALRETIESATNGAPAVFLQGASGDLAPRHQYVGDPAVADAHGRQLAHAALATRERRVGARAPGADRRDDHDRSPTHDRRPAAEGLAHGCGDLGRDRRLLRSDARRAAAETAADQGIHR